MSLEGLYDPALRRILRRAHSTDARRAHSIAESLRPGAAGGDHRRLAGMRAAGPRGLVSPGMKGVRRAAELIGDHIGYPAHVAGAPHGLPRSAGESAPPLPSPALLAEICELPGLPAPRLSASQAQLYADLRSRVHAEANQADPCRILISACKISHAAPGGRARQPSIPLHMPERRRPEHRVRDGGGWHGAPRPDDAARPLSARSDDVPAQFDQRAGMTRVAMSLWPLRRHQLRM
jgi:hypothetical protein